MKKIYSLVLLLLCSINAFAADFYWVGGNGNWSDFQHHWALSSGGGLFHTTVPSAFDNVFFDGNSFPTLADSVVTIDLSVASMKNLTFTTAQKVKMEYTSNFTSFHIHGSAVFTEGVDMSTPTIYFKSQNPNCLITSHKSKWRGATLYFDGVGGSWEITDSLTFASDITLVNGTLNVVGKKMTCLGFRSENENVRGWNFAHAQISAYNIFINTNNLTSTWEKSSFRTDQLYVVNDVDFPVDTLTTYSKQLNWFQLQHIKANVLRCSDTRMLQLHRSIVTKAYIDSVDVGLSESTIQEGYFNKIRQLSIIGTLTTEHLYFTGNDCSYSLFLAAPDHLTGTIYQTSGILTLDYASIKNINTSGGAVFNATNSVDLGNNSGINFPAHSPHTLYWIGNSGNWQDPSHWSLSSGGIPAQICVPGPKDHVVFDENSFDASLDHSVNSSYSDIGYCASINSGSVDQNVSINVPLYINGSAYLSPHVVLGSGLTFTANTPGNYIDFNGARGGGIVFNGSGNWTLLDSIYTGNLELSNGTLYSNGFKIHCDEEIRGSGFANISHSTIEAANIGLSQGNFETAKFILYKDGRIQAYSPIKEIVTHKASFISSPLIHKLTTLGDLTVGNSLLGAMRIDTLLILRGTEFKINPTTKIVVDTIGLTGSANDCKKQTFISSNYIQMPAVISKSTGTIRLSEIALLSVKAEGGANFFADNCGDLGGNTGWQINKVLPKTYYWINDSGDWSDASHWSLNSGGTTSGCIPGIQDRVIFDELSFSSSFQTVSKANGIARISGLQMQTIPDHTSLPISLYLYGNLELQANLGQINPINFVGRGLHTLKTNGFSRAIITTIADTLAIADEMVARSLSSTRGYIDFHDKKITIDRMDFDATYDSLIINMKGAWIKNNEGLSIKLGKMRTIASGSTLSLNASYSAPIFILSSTFNSNKITLNKVELTDHQVIDGYQICYPVMSETNINDLTVHSSVSKMWFTISNCDIQNFYLPVSAIVQAKNNSYIHTFQISKNIELYNSFKVDYLRLEKGIKVTVHAGDTIYIQQYLDAIGNSSFPITLESSQGGQQAHLRCNSGQICCAYLNLSDINVFGGAQFYAGYSSNNIYNNSGWNFMGTCDVLSIDANLPGCPTKPITITTTHPAQVSGFLWSGPNGFTSNEKNITIPSLSTQSLGLYSLLAGGQTRKLLLVAENKPDTIITNNESSIYFQSTDITASNNYNIDWYKDGSLLDGKHENNLASPSTGLYYSLFTTPAGCSYRSNTIAFDDGLTTSISSSSPDLSILIKPVPVKDHLTIESDRAGLTQVTIYDQIGKILLSQKINLLHTIVIDLTTLQQGAYIIKINTTEQEFNKRFVK
ncbi:MAG: hypothetical protein K0R51_1761 [Cytophagaceae bacterium]|jgi:hypothetical protein|nr:hypothetical protein [Cytophagaceae bacterium]